MWSAASIFPFERYLLRNSTHDENRQLAEELLANFPGGNRGTCSACADVSDSLHACLESP
jgi:hypothetical protein